MSKSVRSRCAGRVVRRALLGMLFTIALLLGSASAQSMAPATTKASAEWHAPIRYKAPAFWTAPIHDKAFLASNAFFLAAWSADIETTHSCIVQRTCVEANPLYGLRPSRSRAYSRDAGYVPMVLGESYFLNVALSGHRKLRWISYVAPVFFGAVHAREAFRTRRFLK